MRNFIRLKAFERELKDILKKFPKSEEDIDNEFKNIFKNPDLGETYNLHKFIGIPDDILKIKKYNIGLKKYKIQPKDGLRLIYTYIIKANIVVYLIIYHKKGFKSRQESKVQALIRERAIQAIELAANLFKNGQNN